MQSLTHEVTARGCKIEIEFASRKLQRTCSVEREAQRRWGANWKILKRRLASLDAAETLADMTNVPGRFHQLTVDRAGQFALHLWEPYRLVFEPTDPLLAVGTDGQIDRSLVTSIRILEIVDYHGS